MHIISERQISSLWFRFSGMMSFLTYLLVLGLVSCIDGKFRCDYKYFEDAKGYLKPHDVPANWHEARLRCHLEGAKLASPINEKLKDTMTKLLSEDNSPKCIYTGIHSIFSRGDFHSVEGVPLSKIPHVWAEDEPNNYNGNESCIVMLSNGMLADVNCSQSFNYICYKKSPTRLDLNVCGTTDPGYEMYNETGSCYKFHRVPRTWSRAYMTCTAEGGHLAIINSETEAEVIKEIFAKNPSSSMVGNFGKDFAFMGVHDWGVHGEFLTINGDKLSEAGYDKFSPGEPNTPQGEHCGAVYRNALYNDLWCENRYAFICEKDADSLMCDT